MNILLLFMYIFSFKIFSNLEVLSSSIIAGFVLSMYFIFNKTYRFNVIKILKKKKILLLFMFLVIIILYCLFISTVQMTYEYSIIRTFINQFIHLVIGVFIYSLYVSQNKEQSVLKHILYIFIIQSLIQFLSFLSPQINELLNIFRSESALIRGQLHYGRIRGLAISGQAFFGLGVGYGLVYIYYFAYWEHIFKDNIVLKFMILVLLLFGGASAARSSFVGLFLGLIYFLYKRLIKTHFKLNSRIKIDFKKYIITLSMIIVLILLFNLLYNITMIKQQFEKMNRFSFQIVYNKQSTGKFTTTSTENLFKNMYFPIEEGKTLLVGDGKYNNADGSYYKGTDAGYMRNILYFGILGFILLFFYQIKFFTWDKRKDLFLNITILIYILIMHIKGDVLGFSIIMQSILFLIYLSNIFEKNIIEKQTSIRIIY